jgi:hypothetical protein
MAQKSDFTEDEWHELRRGVTGAGMLVSIGHRDFTDSFGEASALAKQLVEERGSASQLVRDLASGHGTGFGFFSSPQKVEDETMAALRTSVALLAEKAPEELDAYRGLVLDVADAVAEAKGGVQDEERAMIQKISAALAAS